MTNNISKNPEIAPDMIESLIADLTSDNPQKKIEDVDGLTKYIVLKCLADNISNVPDIGNYIKNLEGTPAYEYIQDNRCKTEPTNELIQVPIFTEKNDEFVRFVSKSNDLDFKLLTSIRGFNIREGKEDLFPVKRHINETLADALKGDQDVLIEGHIKVGKTRLVFDVLRLTKELKNSYVFSLYTNTLRNIDKLTVSDDFNQIKKKKLFWFIDDLHYFKSIGEDLSVMYDKLSAKFGEIVLIATMRSDEKVKLPRIFKDVKTIEVGPWSEDEGKEFAAHYKLPMSRFSGTAFSLIKDIEEMKRRYNNKDNSNIINDNCRYVMRYLKLLSKFTQFVDYNILEETFLYLRKKKRETSCFENSIKILEISGFIETTEKYVLSWEPYLKKIVTNKDYRRLNGDLERLITLFPNLYKLDELHLLSNYFYNNENYVESANCNEQIVASCQQKEDNTIKAVALTNWGLNFSALGRKVENNNIEKSVKYYERSCSKYEEAVHYKNDLPDIYLNWGNSLYDLALFHGNDALYKKAFLKYRLAVKYKEDYSEAYFKWGLVLSSFAKKSNDKFYKEACSKFELAVKYKNDYPEAYYNWGIALHVQAITSNDMSLYKDACAKFELVIKYKKDHLVAYYNWGCVLYASAVTGNDISMYKDACAKFELAIKYKENFPEAYYKWGEILCALASKKNDAHLYEKACAKFYLAITYKKDFPEVYYKLGITLNEQRKLTKEGNNIQYILDILFTSYLLSALHCHYQLITLIYDDIEKLIMEINAKETNSGWYKIIIVVFLLAIEYIEKSGKLSSKKFSIIQRSKGMLKETDIVIDAVLENKKPEGIQVSGDNLPLRTAIFLENKIIEIQ